MVKQLSLLIFFSLYSFQSVGALGSFKDIKSSLSSKKIEIKKIRKEIMKLDVQVGQNSKKQISLMESKRDLEVKIFNLKIDFRDLKKKNDELKDDFKKSLARYYLSQQNKDRSIKNLASKALFKSRVKRLRSSFRENKRSMEKTEQVLAKLEDKILGIEKEENEVSLLIYQLEQNKERQANSYISKTHLLNNLEEKLTKLKIKSRKGGEGGLYFPPISKYSKMENKQSRGVTFFTGKKQRVRATDGGQVVHAGKLSTFGNVVIIDHGGQKRSTILGDFKISVKKGQQVKKGSILGRMDTRPGEVAKIYFDLRVKNKIQDTFKNIDKSSLVNISSPNVSI